MSNNFFGNDYDTYTSLIRDEGETSTVNLNEYPYSNPIENPPLAIPDYECDYFGPNEPSDSEPSDVATDNETESDEEFRGLGGSVPDDAHQFEPTECDAPIERVERGSRVYNNISFFDSSYEDIPADSIGVPRRDYFYDKEEGVLKKGQIFVDKKHLMWAVKDFSVRVAKCAYHVDISNPTVWKVVCITTTQGSNSSAHGRQCNWYLRASFRRRKNRWEITRLGSAHDCFLPLRSDHPNLCKNLIAMLIATHVEADPVYSAKHVQFAVKQEYDYEVSYHKAWQGLRRARENVYGTWESSVQDLPKYMEALQTYNPGTVVEWLHKPSEERGVHMLKYVFWAFRPCIEAFRHCRKLISVDGTFFVGKYKHTLLIACTLDANQHVVPLAYAVVDSESYNSWHWFLHMVAKHVVRNIEGVCLISDRNPGLLRAVQQVPAFRPPSGDNVFCLRHVSSNFNSHYKSIQLKDMCYKAGSEHRVSKFNKIMEEIKSQNPEAFAYLNNIDKSKWTLSHDGGKRCGILTTNMSECINGVLKRARRLPITTLVRYTFARSVRVFYDRLSHAKVAEQQNQLWPDRVRNLFIERQKIGTSFQIYEFNWASQTAKVSVQGIRSTRGQIFRVSLSAEECSCGRWLNSGLPCSHAIRACIAFNVDPISYVRDYYSTSAFVRTYSEGAFEPLPDEEDWNEASFRLVHDPHTRRARTVGRLNTARRRNEMDLPQVRERQQYRAQEEATTSQVRGQD